MTQPSGWYDDPQDPSQLRYWDGVIWSDHVTPKVSPTVEQSNIGMPYGVRPAAERTQPPGPPASGWQAPGPQGYQDQRPQDQRPQDQGQQPYGQQGGQWPAYPQAPQWQGAELGKPRAMTPDGVPLSGWWKRVLARIIDNIIISIVALPFIFAPLKRGYDTFAEYFREVMASVEAGDSAVPPQPTAELAGPILQISLTVLALYLVYEIAMLTLSGATLGKKIVGISVRLRDKAGPPPLAAVLKRTAVKEAASLVGSIPLVGALASFFGLIDSLWPLWDDKKQAIHDKVGATNVVVGPQPKRDA